MLPYERFLYPDKCSEKYICCWYRYHNFPIRVHIEYIYVKVIRYKIMMLTLLNQKSFKCAKSSIPYHKQRMLNSLNTKTIIRGSEAVWMSIIILRSKRKMKVFKS